MQPKIFWVAVRNFHHLGVKKHCVLIKTTGPIGGLPPVRLGPDRYENFMTLSIGSRNEFEANESSVFTSVLDHRLHPAEDVIHGDWLRHRVAPPSGSDASFADELVRRSLNYKRNAKDSLRLFTELLDGSLWVKSLFKAAGVPMWELRHVGVFWGRSFVEGPRGVPLELFADLPTQAPPRVPDTPDKPAPGNDQRIHIVQPGDWLSKIAITYYGDMNRWPDIHEANKDLIGPNPDRIEVGWPLVIP